MLLPHSPTSEVPFRFPDLSREIRDQIYDLLLPYTSHYHPEYPFFAIFSAPNIAVLRVCKQLHDEGALRFYSRITFPINRRATKGGPEPNTGYFIARALHVDSLEVASDEWKMGPWLHPINKMSRRYLGMIRSVHVTIRPVYFSAYLYKNETGRSIQECLGDFYDKVLHNLTGLKRLELDVELPTERDRRALDTDGFNFDAEGERLMERYGLERVKFILIGYDPLREKMSCMFI
jgi:hypothetical protein